MPIGLRVRVLHPTVSLDLTPAPSSITHTIAFFTPTFEHAMEPAPIAMVVSHPGFVRDLGGADVAGGATYKEYVPAKVKMLNGGIDFDTDDIRVLLVMSNTTADTEVDTEFISLFTTLDEMNGASYARQALATEAVNLDTPNARAEFDAADEAFPAMSNGTRQLQGLVIFKFVTNDADSIPIWYLEFGATFNPGGGVITLEWNAEGIMWLT